jgi:hypothetical protein
MHKRSRNYFISISALVAALILVIKPCLGQVQQVPGEFQDLYSELDEELNRVESSLDLRPKAGNYPLIFGAQLLSADAGRLDKLVEPGEYEKVLMQLERFKGMGLALVTVSIGFPNLYQPFYKDKKNYVNYLDFYKRLSADIKSRGMKLVIEAQPFPAKLGVSHESSRTLEFLRKFKFKEYIRARSVALLNIAGELKPDYLSIISEPDTEAMLSGQPVDDPKNSSLLVNAALDELKKAKVKGASIGAGVGIWHPRFRAFVLSFSQCKRLKFIDLHIYPVNLGLLERIEESADIAIKHRKKIGISEAWLYKCRTRELGRGFYAPEIFSRDVFSFWEPLDKKFIRIIAKLARINQYEFLSLFWSKYFYAYLDYGKVKEVEPAKIANISSVQAAGGLIFNKYTGLTESLMQLIKEGQQDNK